jgi:hypothetical protein
MALIKQMMTFNVFNMERTIGIYEILQKINDNSYKLHILSHLMTFNVFNVQHLTLYLEKKIKPKDDLSSNL